MRFIYVATCAIFGLVAFSKSTSPIDTESDVDANTLTETETALLLDLQDLALDSIAMARDAATNANVNAGLHTNAGLATVVIKVNDIAGPTGKVTFDGDMFAVLAEDTTTQNRTLLSGDTTFEIDLTTQAGTISGDARNFIVADYTYSGNAAAGDLAHTNITTRYLTTGTLAATGGVANFQSGGSTLYLDGNFNLKYNGTLDVYDADYNQIRTVEVSDGQSSLLHVFDTPTDKYFAGTVNLDLTSSIPELNATNSSFSVVTRAQ
jgi:hypothetical protein